MAEKGKLNALPKTISQAVESLVNEMPIKEKRNLANTHKYKLRDTHFSLGMFIRNKFKLWKNEPLMESCCALSENDNLQVDEASTLIIIKLWERLQILKKIKVVG